MPRTPSLALPSRIGDAAADRRLDALRALTINALRNVLRARAPSYAAIRCERIVIRRSARAMPLRGLPMPAPLGKAVTAAGRRRLGDLDGLTYGEVLGRDEPNNEAMRQLHGLLRIAGALEPDRRPLFSVPATARAVALREVSMPASLRKALDTRGVRTVGQLGSLTFARLGWDFDGNLWNALHTLVARVQSLPARSTSFARAIDAAMDRMPPARRRALDLRFGAKGKPIRIRDIAARCGLEHLVDPHRLLDRWTQRLAEDAGPDVARAQHELVRFAGKRSSRPTSEEVDALLGVTTSRPRHGRDYYLRLLSRLRPRVKFAVVWGKDLRAARRAATRKR